MTKIGADSCVDQAHTSDRIRVVMASQLRIGDRVAGREITQLRESTACGVVVVNWGFGQAETTDYIPDVERQ